MDGLYAIRKVLFNQTIDILFADISTTRETQTLIPSTHESIGAYESIREEVFTKKMVGKHIQHMPRPLQ